IVQPAIRKNEKPSQTPRPWMPAVPAQAGPVDEAGILALRSGDLGAAFGEAFAALPLNAPVRLPSGRMELVHRIVDLELEGGRHGKGFVRGEAEIHPDDWFLTCHFVDDMVMPGTLMYECCLHTLRVLLTRLGWVGEDDELAFEPIPGMSSRLKCRGQVTETTKVVTYELSIKEMGYDPAPWVIADALMLADGKPVVEMLDMSLRIPGLSEERLREIWTEKEAAETTGRGRGNGQDTARPVYDFDSITAFAVGKPSEAFGEPYRVFDSERVIARLPGPPYRFLDQVIETEGEPFVMEPGAAATAEYLVPADAWYFDEERSGHMPFAVLLEVALQPCGWLAAYMGSALTSDEDLSFRNLGGEAVRHREVTRETGMLTTRVRSTGVSSSGGMIIQHYSMEVSDNQGPVYTGTTYFGFFSKTALANQVGIREADLFEPTEADLARARSFPVPVDAPFAGDMLRMVDDVTCWLPDGGPNGLGFIRGTSRVNPDDWFYKAHFYQDPVWPGSLGLESMLQILEVAASDRWEGDDSFRFEPVGDGKHGWVYRGQILPVDTLVTVQAVITAIDDETRTLTADGHLSVDGRIIYEMRDFSLRMRPR
ncbi:MAG: type I polyketide synthase, partial [Planctomycetota bacterium]